MDRKNIKVIRKGGRPKLANIPPDILKQLIIILEEKLNNELQDITKNNEVANNTTCVINWGVL